MHVALGKWPVTTGPWYLAPAPTGSARTQPLLEVGTLGVVAAQLKGAGEGGLRRRLAARPAEQLAANRGQPMTRQLEAFQQRQTRERTVCLGDGHGAVEADDGRAGQLLELG